MELKPQQQIAESFDHVDAVLRRCFDLLTVQDFASCRKHALALYYKVSAKHPGAIQALGIADVFIAARKRLRCGQLDWYSILQVDPDTPLEIVKARAWKMLFYLNPSRNKFPLARNAAGLVMYAWRVLSDPAAKAKYDSLVAPPPPPATPATFHAVCPYCDRIFEDEIVYKDHSVRCRSCWEAFFAAAFHGPPPESLKVVEADGRVEEAYRRPKEQFPLRSNLKPNATGGEKSTDRPNFAPGVKKSADNPNFGVLVSVNEHPGHADGEVTTEEVRQEEQRPSKRMRVTSPAENMEKIVGRGVEDDPVPVPTPQADLDAINEVCSKTGDSGGSSNEIFKFILGEDDIYIELVDCTDDPSTSHLEQTKSRRQIDYK